MVFRHQSGQGGGVLGDAPALGHGFCQPGATNFVGDMPGPFFLGRFALTQIMTKHSVTGRQRQVQSTGLFQTEPLMHQRIHFRMMLFRLWNAIQRGQFGEQHFQGTTGMQHLEKHLRIPLHQRPAGFLPDPFRHQIIQLAAVSQLPHQHQGVIGDPKTQPVIAGSKPCHPQYPQGVFRKGGRDMAKQAGLQVHATVEGVKHLAAFLLGHGVDGQVTAHQIVVQADIRSRMEGKAAIAVAGFTLGAGQGVLLLGFRV